MKTSWQFAEGDEIFPGRHAVRLLGGGRRYEAYLAWDDDLLSLVTVKILRPALVDDAGAHAGMAAEAEALSRLSHPSIVRAFDSVPDGPRPHLVLEFLDGPRLSTLLRRYGVIVEQLIPLALELASALHYMARRGILHLDVKPRNIVMVAPPRLIDLSVARRVEDVPSIDSPIGTDAYMPPEQADPARYAEIGPASDIWGLGATLYESLTGLRPFPDGTSAARFPQLHMEPRPLPRDVPPALAELTLVCLANAPEQRPTAAELAAALEPLATSLPRARLGLFRPGGRARQSQFELA